MPPSWKNVRVFVSSTFRDMHAERDHLVKVTFPRLRQWCAEHRLDFRGIDLRWGVPKAEANSGRVVEICLEEVDGCRPFFVCLLGHRYGKTVDQLPPGEVLESRGLQATTHKSLTHLEIEHATSPRFSEAGTRAVPCEHAFFYLRRPECVPPPESLTMYSEDERRRHRETFFEETGSERQQLLERLKDDIVQRFESRGRIFEYTGEWDPDAENWEDDGLRGRLTKLDDLGERIRADLEGAIRARYPEHFIELGDPDALDAERFYHETFLENRTRGYVARDDVEAELTRYVDADQPRRPLVLAGPPGSGKSAALAHWVKQHQGDADVAVLSRFVGASQASTNLHRLLGSLCEELVRQFALTEPDGQPARVPAEPKELRQRWPWFLEQAGRKGRVAVVIDALNQLDQSVGPAELDWLGHELPDRIRVVLSAINDVSATGRDTSDLVSSLERAGAQVRNLELLTDDQRRAIVRGMRRLWAKELDATQVDLLLSNPATQNPLFLLVALEELRVFGSFEKLDEEISNLPTTRSGQDGIDAALEQMFVRVLQRLEREESRRAPGLVSALFRSLACAREGLAEPDLNALLAVELPSLPKSARDGELQVVLQQVQPYLMRKGTRRAAIIDFFHRSFWKAVRTHYLADRAVRARTHCRLAEYFDSQPTFEGDSPNERKATELVWQRLRVLQETVESSAESKTSTGRAVENAWNPLERLFADREFFTAKSALTLTDELVVDCDRAYRLLGPTHRSLAASLVESLIDLLILGEREPERGLQLSHVNAWLNYRENTELYKALLAAGVQAAESGRSDETPERERLAYRCRNRLGGFQRRWGQLFGAEENLRRARRYWKRKGDLKELGRAEYEYAYVYFLRDQMDDAACLFQQSAKHSFQSDDGIGGWISQCLYSRARFLSRRIKVRELEVELEKARQFFQETADRTNPDAVRWVANTKSHLFEAAFCRTDKNDAERLFRELSTDTWVQANWNRARLVLIEARLFMLKKEWARAADCFEKYIKETKDHKAGEALAREYLDLGISYAEAGQTGKALATWRRGLDCHDERRNGRWKDGIREAQQLLETTGRCWPELRDRLRR